MQCCSSCSNSICTVFQMPYDKCGITAFVAVRVGFLKWLHFSLLLIFKNWQQKVINSDKTFSCHFWSYCRVRKSLPSLFCHARWSSSWKWRETSHSFFAHGARSATGLFTQPISWTLVESNGSLLLGLWLTSPTGWLPRTEISSGTLHSVIEYGLPLPLPFISWSMTEGICVVWLCLFRWYLRRPEALSVVHLCLCSRKCSTPAPIRRPRTTTTMTTGMPPHHTGLPALTAPAPVTGFTAGKSSWIPCRARGVPAGRTANRRRDSCRPTAERVNRHLLLS